MMTSNISENINNILTMRQPALQRIVDVREQLVQIENVLAGIVDYGKSSKLTDEQKQKIESLPVNEVLKKTENLKKDLLKLKARFSRDTLNIGVIGRARQGKSRLLQSLTGLSRREIPNADGMHCTGVRSRINHCKDIETYAEVDFYSEDSFLSEIISPYFKELGLGNPPRSIEEFSVKEITMAEKIETSVDRAKFEHLKKYQDCLASYRSLLNQSAPLRINKEEIPKFITQYDPDDPKVAYFNYLAVREAKIFCAFPDDEVGKIAVVDMPGLGDTGIGDEERMVSTLGEEIDFILFVRMPKSTGDYWADVDVKLYDIANRALQGTSLETWSFQIINALDDGSNRRNCEDLRETISSHHLKVAKTLVVNCADSTEVQEAVLPPALDYIARHIKLIDQRFMQNAEKDIVELKKSLVDLAQQARQNDFLSVGANEHGVFSNLFRDFWDEKLTINLESMRIELWQNRQQKDPNLEAALEKAYAEAKEQTGIPSTEEIRKKAMQKGAINRAYYDLLDVVRITLSEKFQSQLDVSLDLSVNKVKSNITNIFSDAGLRSLAEDDSVSLLNKIMSLIEGNPNHASNQGMQKIYQGFKDLIEFKLYYRGLAQPRIRKHLDSLTAPRVGITGAQRAPDLGENPSEDMIAEMLQELQSEALYKINEELQDLLWEPSMSAFSIVEEFLDCVLRAEDVESSWRTFLWDHREKIWTDEFQWQQLITKLCEYSESSNLALT